MNPWMTLREGREYLGIKCHKTFDRYLVPMADERTPGKIRFRPIPGLNAALGKYPQLRVLRADVEAIMPLPADQQNILEACA